MIRDNEISTMLHASRLLQQFIVDGYTMMESQRLHWITTHQKELRGDLYQDLSDAILTGETQASLTGKRIILPSSFTGGARYMIQNYQDAMAICRWAGYPDLFITFTCNPAWPKIKRYCEKYNLSSTDKADILCRVFKMKLQSLLKTIKDKKIFGTIRAGKVVLAVASSAIATTLLPSGRTAHSRFAIPIDINEDSDEAPMIRRHCIEAFDRSLKDIMHCDLPFGGKSIVMGGDFRQILPNMQLTSSSSSSDREKIEKFSQWLLDIGDSRVGESNDGIVDIEIPSEILITLYKDHLATIVSSTYPDLLDNLSNTTYFNDRAILALTLECVNQINEFMCGILPGELVEYFSCDFVCRSS
ncbi:uncharacterized protein LOC129313966 [Prosopis cineraria]|uniref:uncharacterized protein LOC129313966 n=1 Tax=Prosopis cineraria TaxID=364024 RepID=UPI00240F7E63|nr:uncharacterized protein LOC129313966 [Prosopis cineraria]